MTWLTAHITREGRGVDRNAAPKQGLPLLVDVVRREWWMLLQLNLLYIICALPLVTLPATQVAASRVCALMLEDRPVYLARDFFEAFRSRFARSSALALLAMATLGIGGYATATFFELAREHIAFALPLAIAFATTIYLALTWLHALTLLAMSNRPLRSIVRLALLGALIRPLPPLGALLVVAVLWLLHVVLYPASILMPAVVNFSFGTLAITFGVHQAAVRLLALPSGTETSGLNAGGSAQLRAQ